MQIIASCPLGGPSMSSLYNGLAGAGMAIIGIGLGILIITFIKK